MSIGSLNCGSAYGIRTRVTGVRGQRPKPLDERAKTNNSKLTIFIFKQTIY